MRTAGPRCTRPPTRTRPAWPPSCSTPARPRPPRAAATAGPRSSRRCSGATARPSELLAERGGLHPRNLRVAAGLGRHDVVDDLVGADGSSAPRPGRTAASTARTAASPRGARARSAQEALDEALRWAARNDRVDALDLLVARGARLDADVYRGTALAWAAAPGAHGRRRAADRARRGPERGRARSAARATAMAITPLHLAAQDGHVAVVELAARGRRRPDRRASGCTAARPATGRATSATTPPPPCCAEGRPTAPRPAGRR